MSFRDLNVIKWGIRPDMPFELLRKTRLVNVCTLLAAATTVPYLFIFFDKSLEFGIIALFCFLALCATWLLNKKGNYHFAKIWLYTVSHIYLFSASSALGEDSGEYLYLIPVLFSAVLLFEFRERFSLIWVVSLNILTFLALELTNYGVFDTVLSLSEQAWFYRYNFFITLLMTAIIAAIYFYLYHNQLKKNQLMLETSREIERTINYFSTSTFGKNSVDEILWDVTKNCVSRLGLTDCVIYLLDEDRQRLIQKAAYGPKNPKDFEILQPLEIPLGKGIVGHVAKTGKAIMVNDTSKDSRYLSDSEPGLSEIAVPIVYNKKVMGVIDSEHPEKNFYTEKDLGILKTISALCANKLAYCLAEQERLNTIKIKMEAEKIKALDELKTKLFANVSHELRTPLTLMMGTIENRIDNDETGDWTVLKRNTNRLVSLINQILDLSKLESGQFRLRPEPKEVVSFFQSALSHFESLASLREIALKAVLPQKELWLKFDTDAMEKIVFNLLSNALKFGKKQSEVILTVEYRENELLLSVTDQGIGISSSDQKKVFDRYFQSDDASQEGTGIGLALTKELVELQDGTIKVKSEPGSGSTFTATMPLSKTLPVAETHTPSHDGICDVDEKHGGSPIGKGKTERPIVLVVEDNLELSDYITKVLLDDYQVITAFDGNQGQIMAKAQLPDLVVSDIMMPIKRWHKIVQRIKKG